jgi:hypothetical protein
MDATDKDLAEILSSQNIAHPRYEIMTERDKEVALKAMRRAYELGRADQEALTRLLTTD